MSENRLTKGIYKADVSGNAGHYSLKYHINYFITVLHSVVIIFDYQTGEAASKIRCRTMVTLSLADFY